MSLESPAVTVHSGVSRQIVLLIATLTFVGTFFALVGPSWPVVVARLFTDGLIVIGWLLAATGFGGLILRSWHWFPIRATALLRFCLATAIGFGIIGLIALGLGLSGVLNTVSAWLIIVIGVIIFIVRAVPRLRRLDRSHCREWLSRPTNISFVVAAVMAIPVAITCIAVFAPPGLLWGDEPNGYDVVEYHLQVPREWFEAHRILPLAHNVFSYFPQGMEIHYLLAMHLCGGPWTGMYVAQLMHAAMVGLAVLSVMALAGERSAKAGLIAGLAMLAAPWLMLLAPVAYNEGALLLNGALATGLASRALRSEYRSRDWLLAGALAGLACGTKLTAVPMVVFAAAVSIVISIFVSRESKLGTGSRTKRGVGAAGLFAGAALLAMLPWLIRNYVWTRNPVFPELTRLFGNGGGRFSVDQIERWRRANHEPAIALQTLAGRLSETVHQVLIDWRFGFLLLPAAIVAIAMTRRRSESLFFGIVLLSTAIFWFGFTHLQSRFFVLAIPIAAMSIASVENMKWQKWITPTLAVAVVAGTVQFYVRYGASGKAFDVITAHSLLGIEKLDGLADVDLANISEDRTVALVGDAKAFFYSRPMSRLRYRTVFDVGSLPANWIDAWVGTDRDSWLAISPSELRRLSKTYWKMPIVPDEVAGRDGAFVIPR